MKLRGLQTICLQTCSVSVVGYFVIISRLHEIILSTKLETIHNLVIIAKIRAESIRHSEKQLVSKYLVLRKQIYIKKKID